ncbi:MAG: RluA family pseudouridine synthase [Elusimicrobia bacterium]|nr:RluA family pseudouridine synthase [Elusimicrobiota bacterium]
MDSSWVEVPFEMPGDHAAARLDAYLAKRLHRYSRAEVQRLIDAGRVTLRGRSAKAAARVVPGDRIVVRYPKTEEAPPKHERLEVLFEDDRLLAVNKPGDLLSHPTDKVVKGAATSILREQFGGRKLHLAHRLDRETSGVLLLAKDHETASALTDAFTTRRISKEYLALVRGRVEWKTKLVDLAIGREGGEIKVRQAVVAEGQPAATEFERLSAAGHASLVLAAPKTGRLHQIRVHLAALGHPVLGDKLYVDDGAAYLKAVRRELTSEDLDFVGGARQFLHAWRLALTHPGTGKALTIVAPPPEDFLAAAKSLGVRCPR